jgi:hypothetical protein
MVEIDHVVEFVGRNEQGSVVSAVGPNTSVRVFSRLCEPGDIVADPASSSVASVDPAFGMGAFETLKQFAEILIGG